MVGIGFRTAFQCRWRRTVNTKRNCGAARLIAEGVNHPQHRLVYQSRSGPPTQPWLEPDVGDVLKELAAAGDVQDVVLVPVGFISDHMEVMFDLDHEAHDLAGELGIHFVRAELSARIRTSCG